MTDPVPAHRPAKALTIAVLLLIAAGGALLARQAHKVTVALEALRTEQALLTAEVTRFRIEQRAEGKGPQALLEKLRVYAPLLTNSRIPEPDYVAARQEMEAIHRAMAALGKDMWAPLMDRYRQLDPTKDYDEKHRLLEAALVVDPELAKALLLRVLQGYHRDTPTSPRLRWLAADLLLKVDKQLAGRTIREILGYESSRGIQPERAIAYQIPIPDTTAMSSGFHNFIERYVSSGDAESENTLLMVIGRTEHDLPTIQECVKALGAMKSAKAVKAIEQLYRKPPVIQDNPIFLCHCLDALVTIRGKEACAFLQEALAAGANEIVINKIRFLMQEAGC